MKKIFKKISEIFVVFVLFFIAFVVCFPVNATNDDYEVIQLNAEDLCNPFIMDKIISSSNHSTRYSSGIYYSNIDYTLLNGSHVYFTLQYQLCNELVYTPNNSDVALVSGPNFTNSNTIKFLNDLPNAVINDLIQLFQTEYPSNTLNANPTHKYNCHSFAWYNQSPTHNDVWINSPEIYYSSNDMSYVLTDEPREGDIICYFGYSRNVYMNLHSGIIVGLSGEEANNVCGDANKYIVQSKWAYAGLYTHRGDLCIYAVDFNNNPTDVRYYRPRTNASYNLTNPSNTPIVINETASIPSGSTNIVNKYEMYELNVNFQKSYQFDVNSNLPLDVRLYDSHMQLVDIAPTYNNNDISFNKNLDVGRYYLRVAYLNSNSSGTISTTITSSHTHNYRYTWMNYTQHRTRCSCGINATHQHVVSGEPLPIGEIYATCLLCNGQASLGFLRNNKNRMADFLVTQNGSITLPNGVIVLDEDDIKDYFSENLVFFRMSLYNDYSKYRELTPYLQREEE